MTLRRTVALAAMAFGVLTACGGDDGGQGRGGN